MSASRDMDSSGDPKMNFRFLSRLADIPIQKPSLILCILILLFVHLLTGIFQID